MNCTELAVVGAGPAGMSAALVAAELGVNVTVIDDGGRPGGQLIKQTHKFFGDKSHYCGIRGLDIAALLTSAINRSSVQLLSETSVIGLYPDKKENFSAPSSQPVASWILGLAGKNKFLKLRAQSVIVATGAQENSLLFPGNDLPGVYGAGAVQTLMNVYGVKPGNRVLMVGSGNIGLIVSYQLLQAGITVVCVVEALPTIGGYHVHAAKLARLGVPILTSHTIRRALGKDWVTGAVICKLDQKFRPLARTERQLAVDTICLAVGLSPLSELLWQAGCRMVFVPELGGHIAWHDENMRTSVPGIFVAGDVAGIEEASSAMLEGRIAGAQAAVFLRGTKEKAERIVSESQAQLCAMRLGPFSYKVVCGRKKLSECAPSS